MKYGESVEFETHKEVLRFDVFVSNLKKKTKNTCKNK